MRSSGTEPSSLDETTALSVVGLSKRFGATRALESVSLEVDKGSIHALLGSNGSGKSTFIKVVAGFHAADDGEIRVRSTTLPGGHTPRDAHGAGLRFVHQDLGLVGYLSVSENLALTSPFVRDRFGSIRWASQHRQAKEELSKLDVGIDPRRRVDALGPVEQTMVAVTRALQGLEYDKSVLFLDEPTARLPRSEVERLLEILETLKVNGVAIVYVTHRLDEVFAAADTVTILRDGRRVHTGAVSDTDEGSVGQLIMGNRQKDAEPTQIERARVEVGPVAAVEAKGISGRRVRDVSISVHPGEIVAVTGLIGSGRSELGRLLYGIEAATEGEIWYDGRHVANPTPRVCSSMGIGYTPQNRGDGLAEKLSVAENLAITSYTGLLAPFGVSALRITQMAQDVIGRLSIETSSADALVETLSGGNQQKVTLGKWIRQSLSLLILDEPLQGIDVGAKAQVMRALRNRASDDGLAVLWFESDIEEVTKWADRAIVMKNGTIHNRISAESLSREALLAQVYSGATS